MRTARLREVPLGTRPQWNFFERPFPFRFLQNLEPAKAPDGRLGTPPVLSICAQRPANTTCPCESRMPSDLREHSCFFDLTKGLSIVGPRPGLPSEVETYNDYQRQRLMVKQGITCYWQTRMNRDSITFDEWVALDLWTCRFWRADYAEGLQGLGRKCANILTVPADVRRTRLMVHSGRGGHCCRPG